jgi:nucleoside-diphosphate-sugar epimerase
MIAAITGGGGFIGSRLVRALRDGGTSVRALLGPCGASVVMPPNDIDARFGEIDDPAVVMSLIRGATVVVHLAGPPSVAASFQGSISYARVHVAGTAAVVDACTRAGVGRLVYVSSAEVYGQPHRNPVHEDTPTSPRSPYAAAKVGAEAFIRAGAITGHFEAVISRPFLVYGPGMPRTTLLASMVRQARMGEFIEVVDPRPVRDYCFIDDVVRALVASCSATLPEPVRVYNLGSGVGFSVARLAQRVLALAGQAGPVRIAEMTDRPRGADILELVSDPIRAASELGWRATTDIDVGLSEMLRTPIDVCW